MKKKILGMITLTVVALTTSWNYTQSDNTISLSDVALDNVEALASGESSGDFEAATGCRAVWYSSTCSGKDGRTHSYAVKI